MELLIMSLHDAIKYAPANKTYAIRISSEHSLDHFYSLAESDNWTGIGRYVFDDVWPGMPGGLGPRDVRFNDGLAKKILLEFENHLPQTETLLVQCQRGLNRSPAIGMALNEIFGLGYDTKWLKQQHPEFRRFVYDTMLNTTNDL